jgi:hypothetical protein
MAASGVAIGIAGALAITRVLSGLLYQIRPTDAVTFFGRHCCSAGSQPLPV